MYFVIRVIVCAVVCADMSLKEALQFLVTLAKEKKKEAARDQRKSVRNGPWSASLFRYRKGRNPHKRTSWKLVTQVTNPKSCELFANYLRTSHELVGN